VPFGATVLSTNISQVMVKLVNQHVGVEEIFLTRYVDSLLTMDVAAESPLLSPRESDSKSRHFNAIMLGEEFQRLFGPLFGLYQLDYSILELSLNERRIRLGCWQARPPLVFLFESLRAP
jgi:hypothetical protein